MQCVASAQQSTTYFVALPPVSMCTQHMYHKGNKHKTHQSTLNGLEELTGMCTVIDGKCVWKKIQLISHAKDWVYKCVHSFIHVG